MSMTLEKIDLIRSRAHVTYEEAKEALEKNNYDEIDALIYLERNKKTVHATHSGAQNTQQQRPVNGPSFWEQTKTFISKMHAIKFTVEKDQSVVMNIPLTLFLLSLMILFPFIVTLLVLGLVFGYKMTFVKNSAEKYEVNAIFDATCDKVKSSVQSAGSPNNHDQDEKKDE